MNKDLKMRHAYAYFMTKEEHYPQTDRFIKVYQEINDGSNTYMGYAKSKGHLICREKAEPNGKWIFTDSWYANKVSQNPQFGEDELEVWCRFQCPELLLWMAEAAGLAGVEEVVDEILADKARYGKNDSEARRAMVSLIKEKLSWEQITDEIDKLRISKNEEKSYIS